MCLIDLLTTFVVPSENVCEIPCEKVDRCAAHYALPRGLYAGTNVPIISAGMSEGGLLSTLTLKVEFILGDFLDGNTRKFNSARKLTLMRGNPHRLSTTRMH